MFAACARAQHQNPGTFFDDLRMSEVYPVSPMRDNTALFFSYPESLQARLRQAPLRMAIWGAVDKRQFQKKVKICITLFPVEHSVRIHPEWKRDYLMQNSASRYFSEPERVRTEYLSGSIFPHPSRVFAHLNSSSRKTCAWSYLARIPTINAGAGSRDGLAFSTLPSNSIPPSSF